LAINKLSKQLTKLKYIIHKKPLVMRKILITPTTDTVTLCLPREWVGKSIICTLREERSDSLVVAVTESNVEYRKRELTRQVQRKKKK
jgi:hypothetical protein